MEHLDLDKNLKVLMAQSDVTDDLHINVKAIRPCTAKMMKTAFHKGGFPIEARPVQLSRRNLSKWALTKREASMKIVKWNKRNQPQLDYSALRSTVNTAFRHEYNYSCKHDYLKEFCVGFDLCSFAKGKRIKQSSISAPSSASIGK